MKKEFATIHERIRTNTDELAARAVLRLAGAIDPDKEEQSSETYQDFLHRTTSAVVAHKEPVLGRRYLHGGLGYGQGQQGQDSQGSKGRGAARARSR